MEKLYVATAIDANGRASIHTSKGWYALQSRAPSMTEPYTVSALTSAQACGVRDTAKAMQVNAGCKFVILQLSGNLQKV